MTMVPKMDSKVLQRESLASSPCRPMHFGDLQLRSKSAYCTHGIGAEEEEYTKHNGGPGVEESALEHKRLD